MSDQPGGRFDMPISVDAVILGGRVLDRPALDKMLRGVEETAAANRESGD